MHVLVVDDLTVDRFIIKKLVSPLFKVTTLSSANEAISFASCNSFQIALLNVMLKEDMDGLALLIKLREISFTPFLAIAISAHVDELRYQKLIYSGFKEVLRKPFNLTEFTRVVNPNEYEGKDVIYHSLEQVELPL